MLNGYLAVHKVEVVRLDLYLMIINSSPGRAWPAIRLPHLSSKERRSQRWGFPGLTTMPRIKHRGCWKRVRFDQHLMIRNLKMPLRPEVDRHIGFFMRGKRSARTGSEFAVWPCTQAHLLVMSWRCAA